MKPPHTTSDYHYAPVPEALLYDLAVSDKAVRVYAVLARHGMDPRNCYPSHARIAELIGAAQRSIQRPLRDLEAAGWIERVRRVDDTGGQTTDGFHVHTTSAHRRAPTAQESADPPAQTPRAQARAEREQENDSQGNELITSSSAMTARAAGADLFDEFWMAYPRKVGKPAALKAWDKARRRENPHAIIAAALRYRNDSNRDDAYTKHPGPWLNDDRWNDPPIAAPRRGNQNGYAASGAHLRNLTSAPSLLLHQPKEITR